MVRASAGRGADTSTTPASGGHKGMSTPPGIPPPSGSPSCRVGLGHGSSDQSLPRRLHDGVVRHTSRSHSRRNARARDVVERLLSPRQAPAPPAAPPPPAPPRYLGRHGRKLRPHRGRAPQAPRPPPPQCESARRRRASAVARAGASTTSDSAAAAAATVGGWAHARVAAAKTPHTLEAASPVGHGDGGSGSDQRRRSRRRGRRQHHRRLRRRRRRHCRWAGTGES